MAVKQFIIYKLHFTAPVHLGDSRDDYGVSLQTIASDTMYSSLISCLAKMGESIPDNGDLGCTISSLFPFYQKNQQSEALLFFPRPLRQSLPNLKDMAKAKDVKKVSWLDLGYFKKVLNNEPIFDDPKNVDKAKGKYLTDYENFDKDFLHVDDNPTARVRIESRIGHEDAVPFYMDKVTFKDYSGLYFMAEGDTSLVDKAMGLLQHEGVGTDRNVGNGFFEYEKSTISLELPDDSAYSMALSSYVPESKQQLVEVLYSDMVAYDFVRRGGWITTYPHNTLRKNAIYMFTYGSVIKKQTNGVTVSGKVNIDLRPEIEFEPKVDHPIWRCGRSIFIPIKLD